MRLRDFSLTYENVYGLLPAQVVEVRVFRPNRWPLIWWAKFKVVPATKRGQTYVKTISIYQDGVGQLTVLDLISVVEKKIQEESTRRANLDDAARVAAALKAGT